MGVVFVVEDRTGRAIRLTRERLNHIMQEHPDIGDAAEIARTIEQPTAIRSSDFDSGHVKWFYRLRKNEKPYMLVSVKYLNGEGFIITAHLTKKIK